MKKIIFKICLIIVVQFCSQQTTVNAQKVPDNKTVSSHNSNITTINTKNGVEKIRTTRDGKVYELELANERVTAFSVNGKIIARANWDMYSKEIAIIRQQLAGDKIQANKDQQQAQLDLQQTKRDQQQLAKDQLQVRKDHQQVLKDQQQATVDKKILNSLIDDLINDQLITSKKALLNLTLNSTEMRINGQKQPIAIFTRYKEKYSSFLGLNFSYSKDADGK